jgi:hypothetical protein
LILALFFLMLTLYTFLHEGGHALLGLLFGGRVHTFSVNFFNLSAHVGIDGTFSSLQQALISAAGVSLPVLVCMLFILLVPRRGEPVISWFAVAFFMSAVNALLAWVVIPVLSLLGQTPSDDSYNFLNVTHLPPLLVTAAALAVYLACGVLFLRKMGGAQAIVRLFRSPDLDFKRAATRRNLTGLALFGAALLAAVFALTQAYPDRAAAAAPPDYQTVAELQLSQGGYADETVYTFTLSQPAEMSFYFALKNIKGGPVQIRLAGPAGYNNIFLDIQDPKASLGQASVHPRAIPLEPGDYTIRVTFPPSRGSVVISSKQE